jgi:hypothetical protein
MIDDLERAANFLSDIDLNWWPFLFVRPSRRERMTSGHVALLATLYGVLAGVVVDVLLRCTPHAPVSPWAFPLAIPLGFFALYRVTFAACWNRRAERLRRGARA